MGVFAEGTPIGQQLPLVRASQGLPTRPCAPALFVSAALIGWSKRAKVSGGSGDASVCWCSSPIAQSTLLSDHTMKVQREVYRACSETQTATQR